MDLSYSDAEIAFRADVKRFLAEKPPDDLSEKVKNGQALGTDLDDPWPVRQHDLLSGAH